MGGEYGRLVNCGGVQKGKTRWGEEEGEGLGNYSRKNPHRETGGSDCVIKKMKREKKGGGVKGERGGRRKDRRQ